MKKIINPLILLLILNFFSNLNAETVFFTTKTNFDFVSGLSVKNNVFLEHYSINGYCVANLMKTELFASCGAQFSELAKDLVCKVIYWPEWTKNVNIGVGAKYHLLSYDDIFHEHDIMLSVGSKFSTKNDVFSCLFNIDHHLKVSKLYKFNINDSFIINNTISFNSKFSWNILDSWNLFFSIGSNSYFNYMLFFSPVITTGAMWNVSKHTGLGFEIDIQYLDFLTLSSNMNNVEFHFQVKVTL